MVSTYLEDAFALAGKMGAALEAGAPWHEPAHALKGASLAIGAAGVAGLADRALSATPSMDLLVEIVSEVERVRLFLELGRD